LQLNQGASLQRLPVRVKGSYRVLPVDSIVCAMTSEKIVLIKTKTGDYRSTYTLSYLEEILPHKFMRVHASCIVNLATVEEILLLGNHSYALKLVNGVELPVGRLQYAKLQQRLGFPSVV
jgi:two-component system response regulator LytT